jgi:PilZ domain
MSGPCTVVIGAQHHLEALRQRAAEEGEVLAFSDTEALDALEAITKRRPDVVTLERLFAATSRGAALINRIKADAGLSFVEIRVESHDGGYSRVSPRRTMPPSAAPAHAPIAVAEHAAELDWIGTRRALRFRMLSGTEAQVDGVAAALVDLSAVGAQVVAPSPLKPNQRVRITLSDESAVVRFNAAIAWASFEIPKGATRYRAGIEFIDAKVLDVEAFVERHKSIAAHDR